MDGSYSRSPIPLILESYRLETLWINGEYMPLSEGKVPVEERGFNFADGIYEVIAAYDGVPILMEEHLDRWDRSAKGIKLPLTYDRSTRIDVIHELLNRLGAKRAMLYGQVTRGTGLRAHPFPAEQKPIEFWFARELPPVNEKIYQSGVATISHRDERWSRCWVKSISLLPNVLAKQAALDAGAFDAILYTDDGIVTESSAANFHIVKDGQIYTHPVTDRILAGCKRSMVLAIAREQGIPVNEETYILDFAREADEAFITSTTINVLPVTSLDGKPIGTGKVGPVTSKLSELTLAAVNQLAESGKATRS